jgi:hypothetical protein
MNNVNKSDFCNIQPLCHKLFLLYRRLLKTRRKNILPEISGTFSGKELDPKTGFYHYGTRCLDPRTSRWLRPGYGGAV